MKSVNEAPSAVGLPGETLQAFDRHAGGYMEGWGANPLARMLRARVLAICAHLFPEGAAILDLGCGPGIDAGALEALGYEVTALDGSAVMVQEAAKRCSRVIW